MVLGLAQAGFRVIATAARERAEIDAVVQEVERNCDEARAIAVLADVTREEDCARVVDTALRQFGRLDVLVNNAGRGMKYVSDTFLRPSQRVSGRPRLRPGAW
jgi:3-oxoacyl-[acyl-carrier protein] reductase